MFDQNEDSLKMKLLQMLMDEMDGASAEKLKKKPVEASIEIEAEPDADDMGGAPDMDSDDMGMMAESPEEKLKRRIEAMRK
jgi:hypothetical protein